MPLQIHRKTIKLLPISNYNEFLVIIAKDTDVFLFVIFGSGQLEYSLVMVYRNRF